MKKKFFLLSTHLMLLSCAQIYPLNTYTTVPSNSYIKDLNNDLVPYEGTWKGTWKGTWNNKTIFIYFKRIKKLLDHKENNPFYKDVLIGRFKVVNSNGLILYDNTNLPDNDTKIVGTRFFSIPNKRYSLYFIDPDMCMMTGDVYINFTDSTNTKLNWEFVNTTDIITPSCPYYDANPFPEPLPEEIILTKQ